MLYLEYKGTNLNIEPVQNTLDISKQTVIENLQSVIDLLANLYANDVVTKDILEKAISQTSNVNTAIALREEVATITTKLAKIDTSIAYVCNARKLLASP